MHWTIFALLSAIFAGAVAILGKIGLKGVDSTLATSLRSVVMAAFLVVVELCAVEHGRTWQPLYVGSSADVQNLKLAPSWGRDLVMPRRNYRTQLRPLLEI
jgi:phosphoglycerol transferase MdoB-like AlkP superfamily enzyme